MSFPANLQWTLGLRELIARYGGLQAAPRGRARNRRGQDFNRLIADLLRLWGAEEVDDNVRGVDERDEIDVVFRLDGTRYLLEAKWEASPVSGDPIGKLADRLTSRIPGARGILLSMSGYTRHAAPAAERGRQPLVLLLDRTHFEAMLSGLVAPDDLLRQLERRLTARGGVTVSLPDLLLHGQPAPTMVNVPDADQTQEETGNVTARPIMVGEVDWPECTSIAAGADDSSVLITTVDGIVNQTIGKPRSRWALPMAGCDGPALIQDEGSMLAIVNCAAVRWIDGKIEIIGGALTGNAALFAGPDGSVWAFQNTGETGHVALTELRGRLGEQTTHPIDFTTGVRNAAWLGDQRFYLAADGHSATVDLAQGNRVPREAWQVSAQSGPLTIVVRDARTIFTFAKEQGVKVGVCRTDTCTGESSQLLLTFANRALGMTKPRSGRAFLLTDQRGNAAQQRPVLISLDGVS